MTKLVRTCHKHKELNYVTIASACLKNVLVKIGQAIHAIFDLVLLRGQFKNTLLVTSYGTIAFICLFMILQMFKSLQIVM